MEQFLIGIIVGVAALFVINRIRKSVGSASMAGGGCCGTCGCKASSTDLQKIKE